MGFNSGFKGLKLHKYFVIYYTTYSPEIQCHELRFINRKHENTEFGYTVMHKNRPVPEIQYYAYVVLFPAIIRTVKRPVILLNFKPNRLKFHLMCLDKYCNYKKGQNWGHSACYV